MKHFSSFQVSLRPRVLMVGILAFLVLTSMQVSSAFAQGARATAANTTYVRVIHASPFVGTADVFVDGSKLLSSFQFGSVTDYAAVPSGAHMVQIAAVGKGVGASLLTQTLNISPGLAYTVAALGTSPTALMLQVFIDNNTMVGSAAKVRLYNLSPDAGPVNVAANSSALVSGLSYQQASTYLTLPSGAYTFNVTPSVSSNALPISATLQPNVVTSIFAVGEVNGTPQIQLVLAQPSALPGLPGTGSDPRSQAAKVTESIPVAQPVQPTQLPAPIFWLLGALGLVACLMSVRMRRHSN